MRGDVKINITSKNIKTWSTIGARPTYGLAVIELAKHHKDLMVVTADVSHLLGLTDLERRTREIR